jgi:hypothetical protein
MTLAPATRKRDRAEIKDAGDYCIFDLVYDRQNSGIEFICPRAGCGDRTHLPLKPPMQGGWQWNEEKKTLSPSILRMEPGLCQHHFSLIDGKWVP